MSEPLQHDDVFFHIPDLSFGPPENVLTPTHSTDSLKIISDLPDVESSESGDIWLLTEDNLAKSAEYQSWDAFDSHSTKQPDSAYITEAGPLIFDSAVAEDYLGIGNTNHAVLDSNVYASSLMALGLGRSSVFFAWDDEKQAFGPTLPRMRVSGCTGDSLEGLVKTFLECGTSTRSLQRFVDNTYTKNQSPGRIALADAVSTLLAAIQASLSASAFRHSSFFSTLTLYTLLLRTHSPQSFRDEKR